MKLRNNTSDNLREETLSSTELYKGKSFAFYTDLVKLPDGRESKKDFVLYPHAVGIIPFIDNDTILLIKQFRYPVHQTIYEIPAGKIDDPEELPVKAAERELREETGYESGQLEFLLSYYPCAAYSTEVIHLFKAFNLKKTQTSPDDDEFIITEKVPFQKVLEMIKNGEIRDAKTIIALSIIRTLF